MACTSCGKSKGKAYGTTTPKGGAGKTSARPVAGFSGHGTKTGATFAGPKQSTARTPISHAQSGRTRRH